MEQLMNAQKMDGIITICRSMTHSTNPQPQIFVEGRPKRQRPTHQGPGGCGTRWRGGKQRRRTLFTSRDGWDSSVGLL